MRRRSILAGLAGAATAWPLVLQAQGNPTPRRLGVLMDVPADDSEGKARLAAFMQALRAFGHHPGENMDVHYRWGSSSLDRSAANVGELAALNPEVILAAGTPAVTAARRAVPNIPVVFVNVADPVGAGLVDELAEPGGNVTGFAVFDTRMGVKWLELIKEVATGVKRVAVARDPTVPTGVGQFAAIQAVAQFFDVEATPVGVRDAGEIERRLERFARMPGGALIVTGSPQTGRFRELLVECAARYRMPAVYPYRHFAQAGGLIAYGPDLIQPFRQAAGYVHRVLSGERPSDLPVQEPTSYQLILNSRTAASLGLPIPPTLLARADEVIE